MATAKTTKTLGRKTTPASNRTETTTTVTSDKAEVTTAVTNNSELTATIDSLTALTKQLTDDLATLTSEVATLKAEAASSASNNSTNNNVSATFDTSNFVQKGQIVEVLRQIGVREHILSTARLK